jgi:hypothetical protein
MRVNQHGPTPRSDIAALGIVLPSLLAADEVIE